MTSVLVASVECAAVAEPIAHAACCFVVAQRSMDKKKTCDWLLFSEVVLNCLLLNAVVLKHYF